MFDIDMAMAGNPCHTRDGRKAQFVTTEQGKNHVIRYAFLLTDDDGVQSLIRYNRQGKADPYIGRRTCDLDLFLDDCDKEKTRYVYSNVYLKDNGEYCIYDEIYLSLEEARSKNRGAVMLGTIKMELIYV